MYIYLSTSQKKNIYLFRKITFSFG